MYNYLGIIEKCKQIYSSKGVVILNPNELARLFLKKSQLQKLIILEQMKLGNTSLVTLESILNCSKRQVTEVVKSLRIEINEAKSKYPYSIIQEGGILQFKPELKDYEYIELMNNFREKYISESSLFRVLLFVFEKRVFSIVDMANSLSYSESYTYKIIGKLKDFFNIMNVTIQLTKKTEILLEITGSESIIRMLHYLSVSFASKGNHWLFTTVTEEEELSLQLYIKPERYKILSPIGRSRMNYMLAVCDLGMKSVNKLEFLNKDVEIIGELISKNKECTLYSNSKINNLIDNKILFNELIHLEFFANYFTQELRTKAEKEKLGQCLLSLKENKIVQSCINLLDGIKERFPIPDTIYNLLVYSLCNRLVVIHYLDLHRFMPLYKVPPLTSELECFVEKCIDHSLNSYSEQASYNKIKYSFTQIIAGYLSMLVPTAQKVYVEFFFRPEYKSIIENAIESSYNSKVIQIAEIYSEADIVISDTYGYKNEKYFYFKDVFDQNSWQELGAYLNHVISNNIIEKNN